MPISGARNRLAMYKVLNHRICLLREQIGNACQHISVILSWSSWLLYVRFGFRPMICFGKARIKEHSLGLQSVAKLGIDRVFDPQHHLTNLMCAIDIFKHG
jgi:hypothetical protein